MKRTLFKAWKVFILWLFVCYELGSMLDYAFFFFLNLALSLASWILHIIVYILYNCIFYSIKVTCVFLLKWAVWFFLLGFHLLILSLPILIEYLLIYCDDFYIAVCKEIILTCNSLCISVTIVSADVLSAITQVQAYFF